MFFVVQYENLAHGDEARDRRTSAMLAAWRPPADFEMKGWYDYADGSGGVALVETSSAAALMEAVAPWATFFNFSIKPAVTVDVSTPIINKAIAWRDSLK